MMGSTMYSSAKFRVTGIEMFALCPAKLLLVLIGVLNFIIIIFLEIRENENSQNS